MLFIPHLKFLGFISILKLCVTFLVYRVSYQRKQRITKRTIIFSIAKTIISMYINELQF